MPDIVHSPRSPHKVLRTFDNKGMFKTLSDSEDGTLRKNNYTLLLILLNPPSYLFDRVLNMAKFRISIFESYTAS